MANYSVNVFQEAKHEGHPVMMFVRTDTCDWCEKMATTTFKNPEVYKIISENFYPVILHASKNMDTVKKYKIDSAPTVVFFDLDGKIKKSFVGYAQPEDMIKHMNQMLLNPPVQ